MLGATPRRSAARCTVSPSASGTLGNTATVTAGPGAKDTNPNNDSATDTDNLTPTADLAVALAACYLPARSASMRSWR